MPLKNSSKLEHYFASRLMIIFMLRKLTGNHCSFRRTSIACTLILQWQLNNSTSWLLCLNIQSFTMLDKKTLKISHELCIRTKEQYEDLFHIRLPWTNQQHTECSICISNVESFNGGHITCGHVFHNNCISNWIKHAHNTCPNCRNQFDENIFLV